MNRQFANAVIWVTALTYAGFGVWLGLQPDALLQTFGIENPPPAMLTEIRAFYGGIEIGISLAMLVLWHRNYVWPALLVGAIPLVGSAAGRCLGMAWDGFSTLHAVFAVFELLGFAFCVAGMVAVKQALTAAE